MTVEQTIEALVEVQKVRQELLQTRDDGSLHPRDVMKGRCQSFADISCDIGVYIFRYFERVQVLTECRVVLASYHIARRFLRPSFHSIYALLSRHYALRTLNYRSYK